MKAPKLPSDPEWNAIRIRIFSGSSSSSTIIHTHLSRKRTYNSLFLGISNTLEVASGRYRRLFEVEDGPLKDLVPALNDGVEFLSRLCTALLKANCGQQLQNEDAIKCLDEAEKLFKGHLGTGLVDSWNSLGAVKEEAPTGGGGGRKRKGGKNKKQGEP
ncbi:hypothetical protein PCASD_10494 [Puccinia coronata f. sp. avenae]|uniref:Uncharacterized protein n=1 Tax=Puccinia coronata f. sp. avenae TaxID=200324 RepID=A0A2N5TFG3_9BASI|nr:hypothetical protein PCASD_10494 [Puccinia coronata f. sp. avenae]